MKQKSFLCAGCRAVIKIEPGNPRTSPAIWRDAHTKAPRKYCDECDGALCNDSPLPAPQLSTIAELAARSGISPRTLRQRAKALGIPPVAGALYALTPEEAQQVLTDPPRGARRKPDDEITRSARSHRKRRARQKSP
jgi:hypothetical protein